MTDLYIQILSQIISTVSIVVTAIIAVYSLRKQSWSKTVSETRNQWLNDFRDEVSIIVAVLEEMRIYNVRTKCYPDNCAIHKAYIAKEKLYTRLNTNKLNGNEHFFLLKPLVYKIEFTPDCANSFNRKEFLEVVNQILELEWKKVKKEAKGEML